MTLRRIHKRLATIYDLDHSLPIDAFVCDEKTARAAVGDDVHRGEVVWLRETEGEVAIGLYVEEEAIKLLSSTRPVHPENTQRFQAFCLAAEGVSHVTYLHHRGSAGQKVSLLELELQAEVDKYALGLLQGQGAGLIMQRSRRLRQKLFSSQKYIDEKGSEAGDRYRTATHHAARLSKHLEERFVRRGAIRDLATFLRRFYRKSAQEKLAVCAHQKNRSL